jgi:hypothetical protein
MAKARIQVKLDSAEVRNLLKGSDVSGYLMGLGQEVANAAGADYQVSQGQRTSRAVVNVFDPSEGAMFREAATGQLARALGSVSR